MEFVDLPLLKLNGFFWRYKEIKCSIDPISEIITEFKTNSTWDIGKIAFLKELGRAAYSDKVDRISLFKSEYERQNKLFEDIALAYIAPYDIIPKIRGNSPIAICPVCGLSTLLENKDKFEEENDSGEIIGYKECVVSVNCIHCGFEILDNNIKNPSAYGYNNLPDWF